MKEELVILLELQDLEMELERALRRREEIPEEIKNLEAQLKGKEKETKEFEEAVKRKKIECDKLNLELKSEEEKLVKKKGDLLYIKTNEEYRAILHEIELIKKRINELEDMAINELLELERMESELPEKKEELKKFRVEIEKRIKELEDEAQENEKRIENLKIAIEGKVKDIPEKLIQRYKRIKEKRGLPAIVPIVNGTCGGCHAELPINLVLELQMTGDIGICENCGRLIIYKENEES